jgi:uncharacterized membrane protein
MRLKIKLGTVLLAINVLAIFLIIAIYFISGNPIRIIIGLPFLLFFPGYVLLLAIFPRKESLGILPILALSLGLSIAVVSLMGLLLNFTPRGMETESVVFSLFAFLLIVSSIAWLRSKKLPTASRRYYSFNVTAQNLGQSKLDRWISVVMILLILGTLGTLGFLIANQKIGGKFSEFYMLGIDGQAADYPADFVLNNGQVVSVKYGNNGTYLTESWGRLTLGIVNHEGQETNYSVTMTIDGTQVNIPFQGKMADSINSITLLPGEKWEQEIGVTPQHTGDNQKVAIFLYKNGANEPYLDLNRWINVHR